MPEFLTHLLVRELLFLLAVYQHLEINDKFEVPVQKKDVNTLAYMWGEKHTDVTTCCYLFLKKYLQSWEFVVHQLNAHCNCDWCKKLSID